MHMHDASSVAILTVSTQCSMQGSWDLLPPAVNSSVAVSMSVEDLVQTKSPFRRKFESNLPIVVQLDRCACLVARPETWRNRRIMYSRRMHVGECPAGNRCKALQERVWRCVQWVWQKSARQLSATNVHCTLARVQGWLQTWTLEYEDQLTTRQMPQ